MGGQIKDGVACTVGGQARVDWINESSGRGRQTATAIPPMCAVCSAMSSRLGCLETGASDIVLWDAPKVTAYSGWKYALMLAGADQAARWRPAPDGQPNWKSTELPELMFAEDRSGPCPFSGMTTGPASADQRHWSATF